MQSLVFLTYYFKSYRRKTFGDRLDPVPPPPPPLVQKGLRHNINPNEVHQESISCINTRDPENVAKTRDQSVLSDLSDSSFYSDNDEVLCTAEKQSDGNGE